jgi:hypothetical protein
MQGSFARSLMVFVRRAIRIIITGRVEAVRIVDIPSFNAVEEDI